MRSSLSAFLLGDKSLDRKNRKPFKDLRLHFVWNQKLWQDKIMLCTIIQQYELTEFPGFIFHENNKAKPTHLKKKEQGVSILSSILDQSNLLHIPALM